MADDDLGTGGGSDAYLPDVGDRHDGIGRHVGSFWFLPTLEAGTFYDSNPGGVNKGAKGDFGGYVAPRLRLESDWGRHALNAEIGASEFAYFDESKSDRLSIDGAIDGRIDIFHDLSLAAGVKAGIFEDQAGSVGSDSLADGPTRHRDMSGWATLNKTFNRLSISVGAGYETFNFDDVDSTAGGKIDQDFRDGSTLETGGRLAYEISPGTRAFGDFRYNWRNYDSNLGESDGWRGLAGLEFDIGRLVRGEISAGYMEQYYDGGGTESGLSYHAGLTWNPTPLMTVKLDADRSIADSTVTGSAGMVLDNVKASLDYEVLRSVILSPHVSVTHADYFDIDRTGLIWNAGTRLDYAMNRFLSIGLNYEYTNADYKDSKPGVNDDFDRHVISAYAQARF